jgi:dynein heavy chain 1, cytosolic
LFERVLDDNKILTLPSGERLSIPDNIRLFLEVDSLAHATPATVSRCGMVWFSENEVTVDMAVYHLLHSLTSEDLVGGKTPGESVPTVQLEFMNMVRPMLVSERTTSLVVDALDFSMAQAHVMQPSRGRFLHSFRALLTQGLLLAIDYDENHPDFPMTGT